LKATDSDVKVRPLKGQREVVSHTQFYHPPCTNGSEPLL